MVWENYCLEVKQVRDEKKIYLQSVCRPFSAANLYGELIGINMEN